MKTRALVENGTNEEVSLISIEIPLIAKNRDSLILKRNSLLTLVGILQDNGGFISRVYIKTLNPKEIPKYLLELNPRILILEDGRVFYDLTRSDPEAPGEIYEINLFLGENFRAYGVFEERFNRLYEDFKRVN